MSADLFRPAGTLTNGPDPVAVDPVEAGWDYCGLRVWSFTGGQTRTLQTGDNEAVLVPLSGSFRLEADDDMFELDGREDVFAAVTDVIYLPPRSTGELTAPDGGELAMATAPADQGHPPRRFDAAEIAIEIRGSGMATRQVNNLLSADIAHAERIIVVEVLTPEGNWSSWPPHKHDEWSDCEVPLEEIYYFRVQGEGGFGLHRTYTKDRTIDATVTVHDGDVFLIPRGYHGPCVAAPGHHLYYLNVMAGPGDERVWKACDDPAHAWVRRSWDGIEPDPRLPLTEPRGDAWRQL
ncbi:MAG TPA: 5-deoxy-glucuronate isomerase [Acidimicrobiia bacterium]|nr:5-deoxy-glucuronate isomerase [Acidimicrobiia bacterium]